MREGGGKEREREVKGLAQTKRGGGKEREGIEEAEGPDIIIPNHTP